MDLKSFHDKKFDPKQSINEAWKANTHQIDEEVFVNNLVNKLELHMKQLNHSIEETSSKVVSWMPKTIEEAKSVQCIGEELRNQLVELEEHILDVEEKTGQSVLGLQRIHNLKSKLENASSSLKEADKWAQLLAQLEDILEAGVTKKWEKLQELINLVYDMTNCLEVLVEAPDYTKKRNQFQAMCDRLEATYSPQLVDALTQKNIESTRAYVRLFASMRRGASLLRYWRRIEMTRLQTQQSSRGADSLHALLQHAQNQLEWLRDVLECSTPLTVLTRLYTEVLSISDPNPTKLIRTKVDMCATPSDGIAMLCDLQTTIAEFMKQYRSFVEANQGKEKLPDDCIKELGIAVSEPLSQLLPRYTELQARLLTDQLKEVYKSESDSKEICRLATSSVERSSAWLDTALNNCKKIAGNSYYAHLTPAIEAFISSHCTRLTSNLRLLSLKEEDLPSALALTIASGNLALIVKAFQSRTMEDYRTYAESSSQPDPWVIEVGTKFSSLEEPFSACIDDIKRVCRTLKGFVLKILFEPVALELEKVPALSIWCDNDSYAADLPDFSLSPQEYITQIGQYLLTLPQHVEPYLTLDGQTGLAYAVGAQAEHLSWYFVNEVCNLTSEMYVDKILSIKKMDALGAKRCVTDISYLSSVMEDLGGKVSLALKNLESNLRNTQKRV